MAGIAKDISAVEEKERIVGLGLEGAGVVLEGGLPIVIGEGIEGENVQGGYAAGVGGQGVVAEGGGGSPDSGLAVGGDGEGGDE